MDAKEMLPCPFCGGTPSVDSLRIGDVWCHKHTQAIPIQQWNRRALLAQPAAEEKAGEEKP